MAMPRPSTAGSTRARTQATGTFVRSTPGSHSLERGLALLRAFRHGVDVLTNAELADRTQLPRPTVSRLTRSLVDAGFLAYDIEQRGYRLTAACLSLALSFRSSEATLARALPLPLMRALAEGRRVNVGLAVADQLEMVYLESVRLSRLGIFRRILPGSRLPIASTSLGCAFLAGMQAAERKALLGRLRQAHGAEWRVLQPRVEAALEAVRERGFCHASWAAGMTAVALPLRAPSGSLYAMNVSFPTAKQVSADAIEAHAQLLLRLAADLRRDWAR